MLGFSKFIETTRQIDSMNRLLQTQWIVMFLSVSGMLSGLGGAAAAETGASSSGRWAIALHGGAGRIARDLDPKERKDLEDSLTRAISAGKEILAKGGSALDAVQAVVVNMEDNPR